MENKPPFHEGEILENLVKEMERTSTIARKDIAKGLMIDPSTLPRQFGKSKLSPKLRSAAATFFGVPTEVFSSPPEEVLRMRRMAEAEKDNQSPIKAIQSELALVRKQIDTLLAENKATKENADRLENEVIRLKARLFDEMGKRGQMPGDDPGVINAGHTR